MKILLALLLIIVASMGAALFFLSGDWSVVRNGQVAGAPADVHAVVENLSTWPDWSYWSKETDPEATFTFTGPASGPGCTWSWVSEGELGSGTMKVVSSSVEEGMCYAIEAEGMTLEGKVLCVPSGDGTDVIFSSDGTLGGAQKLMAPLIDRFVGPSYESSVQGLAAYVSAQAGQPAGGGEAGGDPADLPAED